MQGIEERRLVLQTLLDQQKTQEERNRFGQFTTPQLLAQDIARCAVALLPSDAPIRFLDPAIGTGSFYSALRMTVPAVRIIQSDGYEIDAHYADPARNLWIHTPLQVHRADFTRATPLVQSGYNLVISNPPYVRHHHLSSDEKTRLQKRVQEQLGVKIDGLSGLYCYFVMLAHQWMSSEAVAAWLLPSEFMDVNYGRILKWYLLNKVTLLHIHHFDPQDMQFEDALVSSSIVFFRNTLPPSDHVARFTYGSNLESPVLTKLVSVGELGQETKWTRFSKTVTRQSVDEPALGDYFHIKRGIATGANDFFVLSVQQIEEESLPWNCFRPILPSPRYLDTEEIFADTQGNPLLNKRLFLLDCNLPEEEIRTRYPTLWRYLQRGKPHVSERYLCKRRRPWYSQEKRLLTPFLCTYIGRGDTKRGNPFRFILNHSRATVTNVYLLLYPKPLLAEALATSPSLLTKVQAILRAIEPTTLTSEGRVYGGGLHKLEPKELANVRVNGLNELLQVYQAQQAVQQSLFK
jgi:hypothetical protein